MTSTQTTSSFGIFFLGLFFFWDWSLRTGPPSPLECNSILPLVTAVLITPKGAEPPDSRRIGDDDDDDDDCFYYFQK